MRIIIIGGGEIGYALARALAPNHYLHVIDHNPATADRFHALDVSFVLGSGTSASVLRVPHVESSDLAIACTGLDEVNIVACSIAKTLGATKTVCFVSGDDFLGSGGGGNSLRDHFGVDQTIWPEAQLADDIQRIIAAPGAIDAESFAEGQVQLLEYRLEVGSPLTAAPISSLQLPRGIVMVAAKRGDTITIPRGDTHLKAGDKVIVMGRGDAMSAMDAKVAPSGRSLRDAQQVTIIGGGDVGFRLAQLLDSRDDVSVRIIERDPGRGEMLAATLTSALVLNGDGTDLELLEMEEIGRSDVLVSVIDNDERNLLASLLGRQLGVGKIITRVSTLANLRLFERVGIDVALSAKGAAVESIVREVEGGKAKVLAVLEEGEAEVFELTVPDDYPTTTLRDLATPPESIVGTIIRHGDAIVPHGNDRIEPGDRLLVFCTDASADLVRKFFASS
ncbi:MAG: Trk system potassium transporter TrkA [Acidobacteria bacterium]|nr:Trk system potassium transporter TrkA [Acidobacteriota bacterium]